MSEPVSSAASSKLRQALCSRTSSLSRNMTYCPRVCWMPWFRGSPPAPLFSGSWKALTRSGWVAASACATSKERSVLQSSTITTSTSRSVWSSTDWTAVGNRSASL